MALTCVGIGWYESRVRGEEYGPEGRKILCVCVRTTPLYPCAPRLSCFYLFFAGAHVMFAPTAFIYFLFK
jgi:hypothetical protein